MPPNCKQRIGDIVAGWAFDEPLLLAVWTLHQLEPDPQCATIRVGSGRIQYNPRFIDDLSDHGLEQVLKFEAVRIALAHPYGRRQPKPSVAYAASNLAIGEAMPTNLPVPSPTDLFGDDALAKQHFESYYRALEALASTEPGGGSKQQEGNSEDDVRATQSEEALEEEGEKRRVGDGDDSNRGSGGMETGDGETESPEPCENGIETHLDPAKSGVNNVELWEPDDLIRDQILAALSASDQKNRWGSIGSVGREMIRAELCPRLDYRGVLRRFRQTVLSQQRRLTRMKASRRYGLEQLGSRYEFSTQLLFAVDVSGSMSSDDLQVGFSLIRRFFRYGIRTIDCLAFDTQIRGRVQSIDRIRRSFEVVGRGGTDLGVVLKYVDAHPGYDGVIVYSDGLAPVPAWPESSRRQSRHPPLVWLFNQRENHDQMAAGLRPLGAATYVHA